MRRFHLIELHEQSWYPDGWRRIFQRGLGKALALTGAFENFYDPLRRFLERTRPRAILDLCSGSGEATCQTWNAIAEGLGPGDKPVLILSDLYPDLESYRTLKEGHPDLIDFRSDPVDARRPPETAAPVRALFNCLHHFEPPEAREILQDAAANAEGIVVFEVSGRTWKNMFHGLLALPMAGFLTAFLLRPFRLRNFVWGLLIPVIPITVAFDGLVSNLRTYTLDELRALTESIDGDDFEWEIGHARIESTGLNATYLLGWKSRSEAPGEPA